jgi:hypothetical protein
MHVIRNLIRGAALAAAACFAFASPGSAASAESGAFVVRLGHDTTSVERFTRTADQVQVEQVGRAPRTLTRRFTYTFEKGVLTKLALVVAPPGSETPTQTIEATFGDSLRARIANAGANTPQDLRLGLPAGTLVVFTSSPWVQYERASAPLWKSKSDTLGMPLYLFGAAGPERVRFRKLGKDSLEITNTHGDHYRMHVDKQGRFTGSVAVSGTAKFAIERVATLDVVALAAGFLAREKSGAGVGPLSPRDSVKVVAGGAALHVDYSRPAKRDRVVYGGIVPYGEVWRTGANAATQFRTDKALLIAGQTLPAGIYTLWTLPTATGWKLIVNSQTGQWGTAHDASKDLFTVDMQVSALPEVVERFTISIAPTDNGGLLQLDWDRTRAAIAFTVQP